MPSILCLAALVVFMSLTSISTQAQELPERLRFAVNQSIKLSGKDQYQEALEMIEKEWSSATELTDLENVAFGNMKINQLINLGKIEEAKEISLELLRNIPITEQSFFIFSFGHKTAVKTVIKALNEQEKFKEAVQYSFQVFEMQPDWFTSNDHELASFWESTGDAQIKQRQTTDALLTYFKARDAWVSKDKLWAKAEPEKFALYNGFDRFIPQQIGIEAKIIATAVHLNDGWSPIIIKQDWLYQLDVLKVAHKDDDGTVVKVFTNMINNKLKAADEMFPGQLLFERFKVSRPAASSCESALK